MRILYEKHNPTAYQRRLFFWHYGLRLLPDYRREEFCHPSVGKFMRELSDLWIATGKKPCISDRIGCSPNLNKYTRRNIRTVLKACGLDERTAKVPDFDDQMLIYGECLELLTQWVKKYPNVKLAQHTRQIINAAKLGQLLPDL